MSPSSRVASCLGFLALLASPVEAAAPAPVHALRYRPGEVLLKFREEASSQSRSRILAELGATPLRALRGGAQRARLGGTTVEQAIARYAGDPAVQYIEPNYLVEAAAIPDDPRFPELWGLRNVGQTGGTPGADIAATLAWDVFTGAPGLVIAVVDSGVDVEHPDLAANVFVNRDEVPANGVDDDGNGFVDDVHGWDFVHGDADPYDDSGHGTHVAGTIGAVGDNESGVAGVVWRARLLPVKFLDARGSGTAADAVESIDYALDLGARIINASWSARGFSQALFDAVQRADAAGVALVAAAGNDGEDNDFVPHYPASFELPNVISVAATDPHDRLSGFSNYGVHSVDLAAPGIDILSTYPGGGYALSSGTSMAAPHVSGALALILGRYPGASAADAKALLLERVDPRPALDGVVGTGGRLNAFLPIAASDELAPAAVADLRASFTEARRVRLRWTATGDDGSAGTVHRYDVRYATLPIDAASFGAAASVAGPNVPQPPGAEEELEIGGLTPSTTYFFALLAIDELGNASALSNLATATTLGPPVMGVSPAALSAELHTGALATRTLLLENGGEGELNFTARVRFAGAV
ncbi:MAG TPA: S8 family serine peptidase, partial [Candidatus Polarisedimenticolaceae bacterium]|nr:S8 family serine peptidase [Candidatus Polarisedimenticolaceae bacterium]